MTPAMMHEKRVKRDVWCVSSSSLAASDTVLQWLDRSALQRSHTRQQRSDFQQLPTEYHQAETNESSVMWTRRH